MNLRLKTRLTLTGVSIRDIKRRLKNPDLPRLSWYLVLAHTLHTYLIPTQTQHIIAAQRGPTRGNQEQTAWDIANRAVAQLMLCGIRLSPIRSTRHIIAGIGLFFYPQSISEAVSVIPFVIGFPPISPTRS